MSKWQSTSLVAIVFLVALRMAIGWQFLYEGMWKLQTLHTATPWSSEGYLKQAQGPLRGFYRSMVDDPDNLDWLDYAKMSRKWYDWRDRFVTHFQLNEEQKNTLNKLLDGSAEEDTAPSEMPPVKWVPQPLEQLPESVDLSEFRDVIEYDPNTRTLTATRPILPSEEAALRGMVDVVKLADGTYATSTDEETEPNADELEFVKALDRLTILSRELSYRHKLAANLRGNPEVVGVYGKINKNLSYDINMGTFSAIESDAIGADSPNADIPLHNIRFGKMQEYKNDLQQYQQMIENAKLDYQYDHASFLQRKLATDYYTQFIGAVRGLDASLKADALKMLTTEQLHRGALPPASSTVRQSDTMVIWGLVILGTLLIVGLFSRPAALLGALMVLSFYMVMPPWPGVPAAPGPEHSFIVNKNLIEVMALIALAALPTGRWFGIDALVGDLFRRFRKPAKKAAA